MVKLLLSLGFALVASGCGGGDTPPPAVPIVESFTPATGTYGGTVDFDTAYGQTMRMNFYGRAFRAPSPGGTLHQIILRKGIDPTFVRQGQPRTGILSELMVGADVVSAEETSHYVFVNPVRVIAILPYPSHVTSTMTGLLPTMGRVGDSGPFYSYTRYLDSTETEVLGRGTTTWSIEADTPTTVFACLNTTETIASSGAISSYVECYQLTATSEITGKLRLKFVKDGNTIVYNKDVP